MVADAIKQEKVKEKEADDGIQCDFDTDDEDDEAAYDTWRLRELTRIKRDREERDQYVLKTFICLIFSASNFLFQTRT